MTLSSVSNPRYPTRMLGHRQRGATRPTEGFSNTLSQGPNHRRRRRVARGGGAGQGRLPSPTGRGTRSERPRRGVVEQGQRQAAASSTPSADDASATTSGGLMLGARRTRVEDVHDLARGYAACDRLGCEHRPARVRGWREVVHVLPQRPTPTPPIPTPASATTTSFACGPPRRTTSRPSSETRAHRGAAPFVRRPSVGTGPREPARRAQPRRARRGDRGRLAGASLRAPHCPVAEHPID